MASLHWAALCYCRITERLIETNDSNNGTLSPQAGFVVGLISVAVAARRTSHYTDPSKEAAEAPFLVGSTGFSYQQCVRVPTSFKTSVINVNMSRHLGSLSGWVPLSSLLYWGCFPVPALHLTLSQLINYLPTYIRKLGQKLITKITYLYGFITTYLWQKVFSSQSYKTKTCNKVFCFGKWNWSTVESVVD